MKLSVYLPKEIENRVIDEARKKGLSPALFIQSVVRERLAVKPRTFSRAFSELAGSWEGTKSAQEIVDALRKARREVERPTLD